MSLGKGRKLIIVDEEVNINTIKDVIQKAWTPHFANKVDCEKLINIYNGIEEKNNKQTPDISSYFAQEGDLIVNYNYAAVRTIVGYTYSQGAQITQRKGKYLKDIEKLTDVMNYENSETIDNESGNFASITGMAYFGTFPTSELYSDYMPDYPIVPLSLDPRTTFVVCSPTLGNPVTLSVTYFSSKEKNKTTFYCYTDNETFILECDGQGNYNNNARIIDHDINPIGLNPIQLIKNNQFMQGDFELAIDVSKALNLLANDSLTDVDNVIKSLLVIMNAELNSDATSKVRKNRILQLIGQPGVNVDAKFIYQQLDSNGMQNLREYFEEAYRSIVGIPERKTRSGGGGDTGDAVKLRDGWADIEIVARIKESYFKIAKKKQLGVAIKILQLLNLVSKNFRLEDIDIKLPRNKNDNIQTKAQSFNTLIQSGEIAPEDALAMADMTTDIQGVVQRAKDYKESKEETDNQDIKTDDNVEVVVSQ